MNETGAPAVGDSIRDRDILCLSTQDWDDLWTRKQRFMREFARHGNRVLYVEAQASLASVGLVARDPGRTVRFLSGPREVETGLYVATLPLVLPFFQMSFALNRANNALLAPLLRRWMRGLGFGNPMLFTYTPHSESLVGRLGESLAIYDCVDEFGESRGLVRTKVVRELERRLLGKVAAVIVTHEHLLVSKSAPGRSIHLVANGAEIEHFGKASEVETPVAPELRRLPRPLIGFVGSLQYWIDFDLIRFLALSRPSWSFVLIGPRGRLARIDKVEGLANVHLLGRKRYEDLPAFVKGFDVCLNPYIRGELARNCSPLKLYEYLASGRPVVSVDMPEARKFEHVIGIGGTDEEVLLKLEETLRSGDDVASSRARRDAVASHSWDGRFRELESALLPIVSPAPDRPGTGKA